MKKTLWIAIVLAGLFLTSQVSAGQLPGFSLPDPHGGMHSSATLAKNGIVVVVTAPTLHDEGAQKGWSKDLAVARGKSTASFVFIEDMSASMFKGTALNEMKKDWQPGDIPILLIDEAGKTREAFGVAKDTTKVFVYDKVGKLVYSYAGAPSIAESKVIWSKVK